MFITVLLDLSLLFKLELQLRSIPIWCGLKQVKMAGELSYRTTLGVEVEGAAEGAVGVLDLIWNAMNVVSLVILLVSAGCVEVLGGVEVAAPPDIAGAQVMVVGKVEFEVVVEWGKCICWFFYLICTLS